MNKRIKIACLMGVLLVTGCSMAQQPSARMQEVIDQIRRNAIVIEFYGKVVDQYAQPVAGASVKIKVTGFEEEPPIIELQTDENGLFSLNRNRGVKGHKLYVTSIEKDGYEFNMGGVPNPYGFYYTGYTPTRPNGFVPDANNPMVYHMRKKGEVKTFVLKTTDPRIFLTPPQSEQGIDFVNQRAINNPTTVSKKYFVDLMVSGAYDETNGWAVRFAIPSQEKGLCASQQILDKAPADGWLSEYVVQGTDFDLLKEPIYIYTKSRNPAIYSRLFIRSISARKSSVSFHVNVETNPYGDTIMEPEEDIPAMLMIKLRDEAREALQTGHLAIRPANLEQLKQKFRDAEEKEREAFYAESLALAKQQRLTIHIEENPFENWTSADQWMFTYQQGSSRISSKVLANENRQWIPIDGVSELGGEILLSYQPAAGMSQPWTYLAGLNKRQVNLPSDANFLSLEEQLVPIKLKCSRIRQLRDYHTVGLFRNPYAKLPLYSMSVDAFLRADQGDAGGELQVMPGTYTIKGIGEDIEHPVTIGKIEVGVDSNPVYDISSIQP